MKPKKGLMGNDAGEKIMCHRKKEGENK